MIEQGQDVTVIKVNLDGRVVKKTGNNCLVEVGKSREWIAEEYLYGKGYIVFDKATDKAANNKVYKNLFDAVDAEEDMGYDSLTAQYQNTENHENLTLVSLELEVWEVNPIGEKIRKVQLV